MAYQSKFSGSEPVNGLQDQKCHNTEETGKKQADNESDSEADLIGFFFELDDGLLFRLDG